MVKKMNETTKTSAEMEADLKALKKQISEKKRDEVLGPFIQIILECQKMGKLDDLLNECKKVVNVENVPECSEEIVDVATAITGDVDDAESDLEPPEE